MESACCVQMALYDKLPDWNLGGHKGDVLESWFFSCVQVCGSELIRVKSVFKSTIKISLLVFPVLLGILHFAEPSKQSKALHQKNGKIWVPSGTGQQMNGRKSKSYFRKLDLGWRADLCGKTMNKWFVAQEVVDKSSYTFYAERQGYL